MRKSRQSLAKTPGGLGHRCESDDHSAVNAEVQQPVWPLHHIADAPTLPDEEALFAENTLCLHRETHERLRHHATHEHVVSPSGERRAGVEDHAARANRWSEVLDWPLHIRSTRQTFPNRTARVFHSVADERPSIVPTAADDVDLVAAARPVFMLPQFFACWIERDSLRIPMSIAPDLR